MSESEKNILKTFLNEEQMFSDKLDGEFISGFRLQVKNEVYHSKRYRSMKKTCSFLIKYSEKNLFYYAFICFYIQLNDKIFAYIEMINTDSNKFTYNFEGRCSDLVQAMKK